MKFEDLKLTPGSPLQLQTNSTGQLERYSCRLIGCLPGRNILLTVPRSAGRNVRFRPGQKMVARLMVNNGIGIFACTLESQATDPYPILFVSYPESINFKGIRGATRVAVQMPVEVTNRSAVEELRVTGIMADVSVSGARLELNDAVGDIGDRITILGKFEVLGISRKLQIEAVIRSRIERSTQEVEDNLSAIFGVEFIEKDEDRRLLLYSYVFSQMAKDD